MKNKDIPVANLALSSRYRHVDFTQVRKTFQKFFGGCNL